MLTFFIFVLYQKKNIMKNGTSVKVKVKNTNEIGIISFSREESKGNFAYALIDNFGNPIWNGNTRMFSSSQIAILA